MLVCRNVHLKNFKTCKHAFVRLFNVISTPIVILLKFAIGTKSKEKHKGINF